MNEEQTIISIGVNSGLAHHRGLQAMNDMLCCLEQLRQAYQDMSDANTLLLKVLDKYVEYPVLELDEEE